MEHFGVPLLFGPFLYRLYAYELFHARLRGRPLSGVLAVLGVHQVLLQRSRKSTMDLNHSELRKALHEAGEAAMDFGSFKPEIKDKWITILKRYMKDDQLKYVQDLINSW